jgi:hypothetical protein
MVAYANFRQKTGVEPDIFHTKRNTGSQKGVISCRKIILSLLAVLFPGSHFSFSSLCC